MDHYDREGKLITLRRWATLFEDDEYRTVARTRIDLVVVSTIWLGIDHGFYGGPPLIFETMTFGAEDEEQYRYATEEEALQHHADLVAQFSLLEAAVE